MATPTLDPTSRPGSSRGSIPLRKKARELPFPLNMYQTAVGKKWVMAATGLMLYGFVLFHMIGNLKMYLGKVEHNGAMEYDIDIYGHFLRELLVPILPHGYTLWLLRIGLIVAGILHVMSAYHLTRMNMASSSPYQSKQDFIAANFASRTMRVSGIVVGAYILFHLADLTWGLIPGYDWEYGHVYENIVGSLSNPIVALIYIVANILLAAHLYHGLWSMFQSLGLSNPRWNNLRRGIATGLSLIILIGNVSFPIAVLSGIVDVN
ncbi:MAG: succinate dehydrogenase cytochrome b subunit [Acidimicrobiales bacterium]